MKPIEFIALHREDDEGCECLILPDGQVEEPIPSHISRLAQLTGADTAVLRKYVEKNMEPLFWLVEYTGCMSVWQTRVVSPSSPTQEQLEWSARVACAEKRLVDEFSLDALTYYYHGAEGGEYERAIAFCNTKNMTDRLAGLLSMRGISCKAIHGDIQQRVREKTLQQFKAGQLRVLVATDVAARGLDIDDVDVVFNYDVPDEQENYVHRVGRTGRAKRHGVAYTLVASVTEAVRMRDIARNTRMDIQLLKYDKDGCLMLVDGENS